MESASKRKRSGPQTLRVVWDEAPSADGEHDLLRALRMISAEDESEEEAVPEEPARQMTFWD